MSDYKADIHKELFEVSKAGDCARVREMLEAGVDPNKYKDDWGGTALHEAAENGHNEWFNYWMSVAIAQGHHEVVTNFLEKVPSVEKQGNRRLQQLFSLILLF